MKTVLITGCNRGLGKTLVESFAKEGYNIIALIRKQNGDFDLFSDNLCKECGITISKYYAEFSNEASLNAALDEIEASGVCIDVLVNNAGINNKAQPIFFMEYKDVQDCFAVNYFAPFLVTKRVVAIMVHGEAGKGSIVNITSTVSTNIEPGESGYGASKAALNLFTQSIAQELAPFNIRVNGVACGIMNTGMFQEFEDKLKKKFLKRTIMKRPADLQEIADMVLFLASDKASYVTGSIVPVDGGFV